jgi:pyrroloquinoline quinone biosynthesis protein B
MTLMRIIVLGASAGGGFPQWNCNCRNCAGYRAGTVRALARTQSSIAISTNGLDWLLINASPDILTQIRATPALQPGRATRDTGIAAVLLMDAQVDHVTGLMMLREGGRLRVHCTASVWEDLTERLPLTRVLAHYCGTDWQPITLDTEAGLQRPFEVAGIHHLRITPFPLSSKAPPYSPRRLEPDPGDNIGMLLEDTHTGRKTFYAPGLGVIEPHIATAMAGADCVLVDGTFWTEDEMVRSGLSSKLAHEMGHLPLSGDAGMLAFLNTLDARRKIVIHINNSNPILDDDSAERAELTRYGVEVAYDGMEIEL